jgi:hypothetical protein
VTSADTPALFDVGPAETPVDIRLLEVRTV